MNHTNTITPPNARAVRLATVADDRAGQRLDNFLLGQLKGAPKSLVYKLIRSGQVRVNGSRARPETRLDAGDQVRIPPVSMPAAGNGPAPGRWLLDVLAASIIFEDARLLAINKPSGIASHGGSGISAGVIETLRALRPEQSLELVHRLDRDTSGLLVAGVITRRTQQWDRKTLSGPPVRAHARWRDARGCAAAPQVASERRAPCAGARTRQTGVERVQSTGTARRTDLVRGATNMARWRGIRNCVRRPASRGWRCTRRL